MSKTKPCADSDGGGPPSRPPPPRIPPAVSGIQYNFCKNPACVNYGIEPKLKLKKNDHGFYTLSGGGKSLTLLKCKSCGERPPLKGNAGIVDELARIASYLEPMPKPSCPSPLCENHGMPLGAGRACQSFGKNRGGSKRYRCGKCHATFSIPTPVRYQHDTHHNQEVFKMPVNKVPFARIVSMPGISWEVFYHRLDFIHRQCLAFAADRERNLKNLPIRRIHLATDRQDYTVNWTEREDKRNIVLSAVASADNSSGNVGRWRFFLDQESGVRSACLSAFQPEIADRTAEAFYVRITKDLTVDRKRQLTAQSKLHRQAAGHKQGGIKTVTTPATRLGLAQAPLTYIDVIYFSA
ncbi:MAG: hypothetical protein NTX45_27255 [Proteobacteria bacterium]|nr:hypothetical protein [Pseudomonadota bacterium]